MPATIRVRRKKCELCVVSWNAQRVSGGLSALVHHLFELEDWNAVLLQAVSFKDEQADMDALEASLWRSQIGDQARLSLGHIHWNSLLVRGFPSLV